MCVTTPNEKSRQTAKITKLPVEIINMIFHELEGLQSVICLCLAHEVLATVGEKHVNERILSLAAPWAGDQIVCLGDYTADNDFPPQLQSRVVEWKRDAIADMPHNDRNKDTDDEDSYDIVYFLNRRAIKGADGCLGEFRVFLGRMIRKMQHGFNEVDRKKIEKLSVRFKKLSEMVRHRREVEEQILCNLSRGEYIKAGAIEALNARLLAEGMGPDRIGFNQVLLSKICWSSDPSCSMLHEERLTRGPWAGDRFEITTMDEMVKGINWQDVTKQSLEWIEELLSEFT